MGSGPPKPSKKTIKNSVEYNWQLLKQGQICNIVKNKIDGREAQQYRYALDNRFDPISQTILFQKRKKASIPIVKSFDYEWQSKGSGLMPANNFRVVTERLTHRFAECPQLSFDESLYVLDRAFEGYEFLYHSIGSFDVNSNMMGFTAQGKLKVWHNQNFGLNYPLHEKRTLQSTRVDDTYRYQTNYVAFEQIEMVRNIVNVVEDRCEEGLFPQNFRKRIRQSIGFSMAKNIVHEEQTNFERVKINRVDLWRNLIKSKISKACKVGNADFHSTIPTTISVLQTNPDERWKYSFNPQIAPASSQPLKSAYSFSQQKVIQA